MNDGMKNPITTNKKSESELYLKITNVDPTSKGYSYRLENLR